MGQNLATGLVLAMQVDKKEADRFKISLDDVLTKMREETGLNTEPIAMLVINIVLF